MTSGAPRSAFIALGSNLGDRRKQLLGAVERLRAISVAPLTTSSCWETKPVDCPPGSPSFLNAVVAIQPHVGETPETLLHKLQAIEREFGRKPKIVLNEPRPLDLDLIAFGEEVRTTLELTLPHSRAHERRFVLEPLAEIAPDLILPGQTRTVAQLLMSLPGEEQAIRVGFAGEDPQAWPCG